MSSTITLMRALVSGLDSVSDSTLETYIQIAITRLHAPAWGTVWEQAVVLLAGHLYQRKLRKNGAPGAVVSKGTGPLNVSYSSPSADEELSTTPAGVDFIALRKSSVIGMMVV